MLDPIEIGDVSFIPYDDKLGVVIAEQQDATVWTLAGAQAAVAYLQAWIAWYEAAARRGQEEAP